MTQRTPYAEWEGHWTPEQQHLLQQALDAFERARRNLPGGLTFRPAFGCPWTLYASSALSARIFAATRQGLQHPLYAFSAEGLAAQIGALTPKAPAWQSVARLAEGDAETRSAGGLPVVRQGPARRSLCVRPLSPPKAEGRRRRSRRRSRHAHRLMGWPRRRP